MKDQISGILIELLEKTHIGDLLEAASRALSYLSKFLSEEDIEKKILRTIISLLQDIHDDNKIVALQLIENLAEQIGSQNCEIFLLPMLLTVTEEGSHKLKKTVALNIQRFASVISKESLRDKLFPIFI